MMNKTALEFPATGHSVAVPVTVKVYTDPITDEQTFVETKGPLIGSLGLSSTSTGGFALGDCRNPTLSDIMNSTD